MADTLEFSEAFYQELKVPILLERPLKVTIDTVALQDQEEIVAQGWIKVVDVEPTDAVNHTAINKTYQDVDETILQSVEVSDHAVDITIRASFPEVTVDGNNFELIEVADMGHYEGTVSIVLDDAAPSNIYEVLSQLTTPDDTAGAFDTIQITVTEPPVLLSLSFTGGYPGAQTELKAGDTFDITGTTDRPADAIDIQDFGAFDASLEVIVAGTTFTVTGTIADRGTTLQALAARVRARDSVTGGFGPTRDTNEAAGVVDGVDLVNLNNLYPSVAFGTIVYPATQGALKNAESAVIPVTSSDFDSLNYDSPNAELQIDTGTPTQVDVTRIGGTYNVTIANLRASANRAANDADTIVTEVVFIAHVAANIEMVLPAARLVSGGNDGTVVQEHTITLNTNQLIDGLPTADEDSGGSRGTFVEPSWTLVAAQSYERTLQVADTDEKGIHSWENVLITNLAGLTTNFIATGPDYELGGFVARTLTFAAFSQSVALNVPVADYSKLQAGVFTATGNPAVRHTPQGDLTAATDEYTIENPIGSLPESLYWNDVVAAATNASGTAQITDVEEVA